MSRLFTSPRLDSVSTRFQKQLKSAVKQCFSAVKPRIVYSTNELFSVTDKVVLFTIFLPFIYLFIFHQAQRLNYAHYTSSYTVSR